MKKSYLMLSRLKFNNNDTNTYTLIFLVIFLGYIFSNGDSSSHSTNILSDQSLNLPLKDLISSRSKSFFYLFNLVNKFKK